MNERRRPGHRASSGRTWLFRGSLVVASTLLGAELLLQLFAVVVSWGGLGSHDSSGADSAAEVVCVGDSFTFGMGASAPELSYPGQLEVVLSERLQRDVEVRNLGRPGLDSRGALERARLAMASEPRVLCVLVGVNDRWRQPDPLEDTVVGDPVESGQGFEWKLRTVELLRILGRGLGAFEGDVPAAAAADGSGRDAVVANLGGAEAEALVGGWLMVPGDVPVYLAADGGCSVGGAHLAWKVEGGRLLVANPLDPASEVKVPGADAVRSFDLERRDGGWRLSEDSGAVLALVPMPEGREDEVALESWLHRAQTEIGAGRFEGVRDELPNVADDATLPVASRALAGQLEVVVAVEDGAPLERIEVLLARMRRLAAEHPGLETELALVRALMRSGHYEEAYTRARRFVAEAGGSVDPHMRRALAFAAGQARTGEEAGRIVAALLEEDHVPLSVRLAALHTWLTVAETREQQTDALVRGAAEPGPAAEWLEKEFWKRRKWLDRGGIEASGRRLGLDPERALACLQQLRADEATDEATDEADYLAVLTGHLERIHDLCEQRGVSLVILTYPFEIRELQDALRAMAAARDLPIADMRGVFPRDEQERASLFAPDGHCSDAGYALMAGHVAERVAGLLRR